MAFPGGTTPHQPDVYNTNSKQILVTRDPVYTHPSVRNGVIVGIQPHTYLPLAVVMTVINPIMGIVALIFAYLSNRAFNEGDLKYANKWSQYAFLTCMITIVVSLILYIAIGFALSDIGVRGGYSY